MNRSALILVLLLVCLVSLCTLPRSCLAQMDEEYEEYNLYADEEGNLYMEDEQLNAEDDQVFYVSQAAEAPQVLTRAPLFKALPTTTVRAKVPQMISTTSQQRAKTITQGQLLETRPTQMQRVHAKKQHLRAPTITRAAKVPAMLSTTSQQRAKAITQQKLMETRPTQLQRVHAKQQRFRAPTITKAAAIPAMQSTETTERAKGITQQPLLETRPTITQEAPVLTKKGH